jgi:hypothetical protein
MTLTVGVSSAMRRNESPTSMSTMRVAPRDVTNTTMAGHDVDPRPSPAVIIELHSNFSAITTAQCDVAWSRPSP